MLQSVKNNLLDSTGNLDPVVRPLSAKDVRFFVAENLSNFLEKSFGKLCINDDDSYSFSYSKRGYNFEGLFEPSSKRVKLYDVSSKKFVSLANDCLKSPKKQKWGNKIFSKIIVYSRDKKPKWKSMGFVNEGVIKGFFLNGTDAYIWSAYIDNARAKISEQKFKQYENILENASLKDFEEPEIANQYSCEKVVTEKAAPEISGLMKTVFDEQYPTPVEEEYFASCIKKKENHFRQIRDEKGDVVSVASATISHKMANAELGECATKPAHRKQGLMTYLLWKIEKDVLLDYDITDFFALARAESKGVNCAFSKLDYEFSGRLINHSNMPNGLESMNIWCKNY